MFFTFFSQKRGKMSDIKENGKIMKKSSKILLVILSLVMAGLLICAMSGAFVFFVGALGKGSRPGKGSSYSIGKSSKTFEKLPTTTLIENFIDDDVKDLSDTVEKAMPSIVAVTCTNNATYFDFFYGEYDQEVDEAGSGVIYEINDSEVLILTSSFLVSNAKSIKVTFNDEETCDAVVASTHTDSGLALLKVKKGDVKPETLGAISSAEFGEIPGAKAGQMVLAIGNALGYGQSLTVGYVSAMERSYSVNGTPMTLIQTDAAINPGNYGGPLISLEGKVIGISAVKYADTTVEGMGYAVPLSVILPAVDELKSQKYFDDERGYFGVYYSVVTDEMHKDYAVPYGLYVSEVMEGSGAEKAGMVATDVILEVNGKKVTDTETLNSILYNYKAGDTIDVTIARYERGGYKNMKLKVTLGNKTW